MQQFPLNIRVEAGGEMISRRHFIGAAALAANPAHGAAVEGTLIEKPGDATPVSRRPKIALPPCGMFVGSGIYNTVAGYLTVSGRVHTCWVPQSYSPLEMLDKVVEDNQGNLAQYWGFSGGRSPIQFARFHALEDLGIKAPEPDWERGKNLTVAEWPEAKKHSERFGAGVHKFVKKAAEKGIYTILLYTQARPQWSKRFAEAGDHYLGYDMGEIFTFRLEEAHLKGQDLSRINLKTLADDFIRRVREHVDQRHATGWGNVMATSINFYIDYEIVAGADIPLVEDFAFSHLNIASSLSRGLYRQFDLPIWGSHLAHEHYSWIPYSSEHKFDLLKAAMYQKYMAGSKIVINESGNWFLQAQLCTDSPMFETPRLELGSINKTDPYVVAPHVKEAQKTFHKVDYHSPVARRYRKVISDFYDFVKANGTPEGQPETTIAIAKGNYDLSGHEHSPNSAIAGAFMLADQNPAWFEGAPERGWNIVKDVFYPRPPVLAPHVNRFLSGTPYGMVDIVTFAEDRISADFLSANYKALLFAGWNTASVHQYELLTQYVRSGGTLFISIPHLSTNITRNYTSYTVDELVNQGDFSELCGVKVKGRGRRYYWATAPDKKGELGFVLPRRWGIMTTCMADIEITDPQAEALVVDDEEMYPVLLRRKCGKGTVYFLNSWAYPGAMNTDEGPGSTLDSKGLIGTIYQAIARRTQGRVWISSEGEGAIRDCDFVSYSYFPKAGKICLQNIDFKAAHKCRLHRDGESDPVELAPGEFRLMDFQRAPRNNSI
ncbi:MAG TPA: hypothetical protein VN428_18895 [Bryobacteraceae bacterium]|nr:hypothetical protein [Bryobacteraceae bacterium]